MTTRRDLHASVPPGPAAAVPATASRQGSTTSASAILLVDDRPSNLVALRALLEPLGRRIVTAESGAEALKRLLDEEFAVILLDVQMPEMDGFELASYVRGHPRTRHTPMIFVTALSTALEHVHHGYEAGAVDYILKPIDPVILRSKVTVFLELSEMHARMRQEAELRAMHASLALAQRAGNSGIWDVDLLGGRVLWSDEYADLIGIPAGSTDARAWLDAVDPRDRHALAARFEASLQRADIWDEEYRIVHPARGVRWIGARGRILRDEQGTAARFTGIAFDITDRKQTEDRLTHLYAATGALAAAVAPHDVLRETAQQGRLGAGAVASWVAAIPAEGPPRLVALSPDSLTVDPAGPALSDAVVDAALDALGTGSVATAVRAQNAPTFPSLRLPDAEGPLQGAVALIAIPGTGRERLVLGVEVERHAILDDATRGILKALALQAGQALERAHLFQAERLSRQRTEALQRATAALAEVETEREVAEVIVREGLRMFHAVSAGVRLVDGEQGLLRTVAAGGFPDELARPAGETPVDDLSPTTDCVRHRRVVLLRSPSSVRERYGDLEDEGRLWVERGALAAVPILSGGRAIGSIGLRLGETADFGMQDREALASLAALAANAVEHARLRQDEERRRRHDAIIASATLALDVDLGLEQRVGRLAEVVTSELADACHIALEFDERRIISIFGRSAGETAELRRRHSAHRARSHRDNTSTRPPSDRFHLFPTLAPDDVATIVPWLGSGDSNATPEPVSALVVPIHARNRPIGTLMLLSFRDELRFDRLDAELAAALGRRAGLAFENARLYEAQADAAGLLQRSLLPTVIPAPDHLSIAARYRSAAVGTEAGGDWYEAVEVGGGRTILAVGDIVGHGTRAAAIMGQIRSAARAYAVAGFSPALILDHLSRFASYVPGAAASTALCLEVDTTSGTIRFAGAGHPPLLVVGPNGDTEFHAAPPRGPLGYNREPYDEITMPFPPGSSAILYTDGAVERRGEIIDRGLERLARIAGELRSTDPSELCDRILAGLFPDRPPRDDVALLVAYAAAAIAPFEMTFPSDSGELVRLRRSLRAWLSGVPIPAATRQDVVLAVGEIATNAVEHAYRDAGGTIAVRLETAPGGTVRVAVTDAGSWRPEVPNETRGRGLAMCRALMDTVVVESGEDGTTVTMTSAPGDIPIG